MNRTILTVAGVFTSSSLLLVDSAIKGTALLMLAAIAAMILRRDSAATRHLVWLLAMVAMLAVPVLSAMLPQWRVLPEWAGISPQPVVVDTSPPSIARPADGAFELPQNAEPVEIERPSATANQPAAELPDPRPALVAPEIIPESAVWSWNWIDALPLVWAIGFCVLILRLMAARLILWNTERHGTVIWSFPTWRTLPASDSDASSVGHDAIVTALEAVCLQLGIGRHVTLLIHPDKTIPVVWGILRCRLLLPAAARDWSGEQLRSVLLHELAHIKRRDMMAQLLAQIACALHWFNPLVWFAVWRLGVKRERACGDLVLASGVRPSAYAGHLLEVVTGLSPARWTQSCGLAMARKSSLEGRLAAVLGKTLNRRGVSVALAGIALAIAAGIAVPIAMLRAVERPVVVAAARASAEATDDGAAQQKESPRNSTAAFLLKQWQDLEGRKTPLAEASIARLRVAIDKWVKQPTAKPTAALVTNLRDWQQTRAEHPIAEVAAWLDEIAAIHPGSLAFAIRSETLVGPALSAERQAALKFGPAAENGLRAAWSQFPVRESYLPGDVISCNLVIQNASEQTIEFECPHSLESIITWEAKTADGRRVEAKPWRTTGTFPLFTWQLKPGAIAEIYGRGVAIGEGNRPAEVNDLAMLNQLEAKLGEQITVQWKVREPVEMSTSDVSFKVVDIADVPAWSTMQAGRWPLPGGVKLEVKQQLVHAADIMSTAILTWPMDKAGGMARHQVFLGVDFFTNRDPWLLAWERGATVLWEMSGQMQSSQDFWKVKRTPTSLRRIDFSNPNEITETTWSYVPDLVPDAIRAEFDRVFLPLATTPPTPAHTNPSVHSFRAEDVRLVTELLTSTWKSRKGSMDVRITFPGKATGEVKWTMDFGRKPGSAIINESLGRLDSAHDNAVLLTKPRRQPRTSGAATLGRLKRGIGDTLLLDIMPHVDYPEYERAYGIVLQRVSASVQPQKPKPEAQARDESQKPKPGAQLKPATEQKLKWGEPANGLRMALAWPPSLGEPGIGDAEEFYLVVQNVSQAAVRLTANDAAPNPRRLTLMRRLTPEDETLMSRFVDDVPVPGDWLLQPREAAFLRLFPSSEKTKDGRTISAMKEQVVRVYPQYSFIADMSIEKAPAGAWTGKLATGETRGSVDVIPPKHKDAKALYKSWTTAARADGKIPEGVIALLGQSVTTFIKNNPIWETTPQLEKMLPRFDASREWTGQDAVALLDELAAVQDTPIKMALDHENAGIIRTGSPLPPELANAPWGEALTNGLRHAWLLEPRAAEHRLGSPLKARVLIHNAGKEPVVFRTRMWHQLGHSATDAQGAEKIKTESTRWLTLGRLTPYRLAPGEFIELNAPGIGVGPVGKHDEWQNTRVGTWIEAKAGDDVTVTTAPLPLMDWNEEEQLKLDGAPRWWLGHITARLSRHLPFPAGKAERELLLYRVAMELFGTPVSEEVNAAFVADATPTALDSLAKNLVHHPGPGLHAWAGPLTSAPTKFRVLPADPDAAKKPRTASNPGRYTLNENATLVVSRTGKDERIVNMAHLSLTGAESHKLNLPDGYNTWAAAWVRGGTVLWVQQKSSIRSYDFTNPAQVKETTLEEPANLEKVPKPILDALRAALDVPAAPKPATETPKPPPAATKKESQR